MDETRQLIERFFAALESRHWAAFAEVLHPDVVYEIPQSRERILGRDRYVQFNREFPGDWHVSPTAILLVVDMANVVGSIPDGWWRDRAGAAERLLSGLAGLVARTVPVPDAVPVRIAGIVAVLEGRANLAKGPPGRAGDALKIIRATGSGDDAVVQLVEARVAAGDRVLVVSADQGLCARLPSVAASTGPGWLNNVLGRA